MVIQLGKDNVMSIRTSEQLQAMFQASRERKQQEREEHKRQRQEQYQLLCKEADRLLKEDAERLKNEKMEQLQALTQQTPQRALKQPLQPQGTPFYGSSLIEDNIFANITVQTRTDIKRLEEKDEGKINWEKWDDLVKQTRQAIKDIGIELGEYKQPAPRKKGHTCTTYVYDINHILLGTFPTARQAEDAFGIRRNTIGYYKFHKKPYKNYIFRDIPL